MSTQNEWELFEEMFWKEISNEAGTKLRSSTFEKEFRGEGYALRVTRLAETVFNKSRAPLLSRIAELEKQLQGERQLRQESEGMGLCMSMVHDDLVQAGVVPAGTAPMFITEAVLSRIDALSKDAERLDSGCIMTHERDDYGQEYKCQRNGLNLRAAIDAAISAREGE